VRTLAPMFLSDPPPSPQADATYEANRESDGYVANFTRLWCWRPELFHSFVDLRLALMGATTLSDREVAIVVAATVSAMGDSYCSLAWGSKLAKLAGGETAAGVISGGLPDDLSVREAALAEWCRTVVRDPMATTPEHVAGLRTAGFDDREIFDSTLLLGLRLAFSTVNDALGALPDRQLADGAPAPVRDAVSFGRPASETASID
jgi:alkylhydroperoxidase family enzyme